MNSDTRSSTGRSIASSASPSTRRTTLLFIGDGPLCRVGCSWQPDTYHVADRAARFSELAAEQIEALASEIDAANTATACSFCNSTTSRTRDPRSMSELIANCPDGADEAAKAIAPEFELEQVLGAKRADVRWKLASVRRAYDQKIAPHVLAAGDVHDGR